MRGSNRASLDALSHAAIYLAPAGDVHASEIKIEATHEGRVADGTAAPLRSTAPWGGTVPVDSGPGIAAVHQRQTVTTIDGREEHVPPRTSRAARSDRAPA